jgi:ubiquinone/menaquinone biosynthesis C-methylase UbiE
MSVFASLTPAEQARQLANPEGRVGIEVAHWLNGNNRDGNAQCIALLELQPGARVLEIGFGNGHAAADIVGCAADIHYEGIDISPTMVDEARQFNAALVAAGRAGFHLGSADRMPFPDSAFDRVFSLGVIHFWQDALAPLEEVCRVLRPDGFAVMGTLAPNCPPAFARPELGFWLRSADEWAELCTQAGFAAVRAQTVESEQLTADGAPTRRYSIRLTARGPRRG